MSTQDKKIFVPLSLAQANPNLIDRVLEVRESGHLPQPTPCHTLWGKYQTLALKKDGQLMKPFRG